ncbi:zinc finger CCCH domain-containing protein 11A-like isoform X2 [Actinia tenebrosa]|uniref:Zinc finger CCCH domain-containing protein 11A-like isoform X2 n=1 Tax=Actinia tenebrosa TaxID=6105 RepID=A0A6P8I9K5_ACTTE|nr:zinc finger CCCH domain-containing protein 11A-like isoform X2 [Actinia tenebrosa]
MSETGDDCYFYYYSKCAKGDMCPFRHQPAALGCEITCHLWEKGRCFKEACTFRHMVIEKERNTIPCFWESQAMGCTKNSCPFLHLKPRQIGLVPPQPRPAMTGTRMPVHPSANQSIPTLHGNVRPHNTRMGPMHPQGPRGPATRPPMYNGPGVPFNQGPYMGGPRPMGYEGFMPRGQPSLMMYQMQNNQQHIAGMQYPRMVQPGIMPNIMMNQPRGNFPYKDNIGRRDNYDDESDDDYTSSDYSDVSISDGEKERRSKPKDYSHRRVRSPRHQSSRREVKRRNDTRDKRNELPRSSREKDKKHEKRKDRIRQSEREKEKNRSKDIDSSPGKSRKTSEDKDSANSERKKSLEKEKSDNENSDGDIKVKTLEEILREKALKNLHERTAQKKKERMEAEKNTKENSDEPNDDSPEPIIKSVVSVNKTESTVSSKGSEPQETDDLGSNVKTKTVPEKKVQLRTAKTIIRSIIESDNQTSTLSTETVPKKLVRKIVIESDENTVSQKPIIATKESDKEASALKQATSGISTIKVKTLEEIRKEKQERIVRMNQKQKINNKDLINADNLSKIGDEQVVSNEKSTLVNVKPVKGRKISIKKRDDAGTAKSNIIKSGGKLLLKRKVAKTETAEKDIPSKGVVQSKSENNENETGKPKNVFIKSFDEIMKEKRERLKKQNQEQQEKAQDKEGTSVTRIKRPTIVRRKETEKTEVQPAPKRFMSRKLKIVRQQGSLSKSSSSTNLNPPSIDTSSTPASPNQSEPGSPASPSDVPPLTGQILSAESNVGTGNQTSVSDVESSALEQNESECVDDADDVSNKDDNEDDDDADDDNDDADADDDNDFDGGAGDADDAAAADDNAEDDDDDESWQHEELPEVPMDTPTLECPAFIAGTSSETPKAAAVFHIPGKTIVLDHRTSPTKRPRSSLEELFGVPCDDDEPGSHQNPQIEEEEKEEVSPAKRVKTISQETHEAIVKAVNQELSKEKEDDFDLDLDLEEEIANLSPGKPHDDSHEGYNEDDLLLELDEMIND